MIDSYETKNSIRARLNKKLSLLGPQRVKNASSLACYFLIEDLKSTSLKVLSFASRPFEINLWPLNKWLAEQGRLLLPKVTKDKLEVYTVTDWKTLRLSKSKIQEPCPISCQKVDISKEPVIILVPGLGFDGDYQRIGRGKGHYDRFLKSASAALTWGIGLKEQECSSLPIEPHDVALNKVFLF